MKKMTCILFLLICSFNSYTIFADQKSCESCYPKDILAELKKDLPWIFSDAAQESFENSDCTNPSASHDTQWMSDFHWLNDGSFGVRVSPDEAWRVSEILPKFKIKAKRIHDPNSKRHQFLFYFDQDLQYNDNLSDILRFQLHRQKEPLLDVLENAKSSLAFGGGLIHYGGQLGDTLVANGFMVSEGLFNTKRVLTGRGLHLASLYYNSPKRADCKASSVDDAGGFQVRNRCFQDQKELIEGLLGNVP